MRSCRGWRGLSLVPFGWCGLRVRTIDQAAVEIKVGSRKTQLRQPVPVETAMGKQVLALLAALNTACTNVEDLGQAAAELFQQHPDYTVITSFPGLADSTGDPRLVTTISPSCTTTKGEED